ncbi:MAG: hypothetical protein ABIW94_12155 [Gemmatimonadaceae bacterium]
MLFVGNSYLYFNDIPGIVQALADSAKGEKLSVAVVAGADLALIDHWNEGTARRVIVDGGMKWVVLQQGPSSVEANRDTLRIATKLFGAEIVRANARPALFSTWPTASRPEDFPRAIESYTLAAADVNGLLLPVAAAWLAAWEKTPALPLYADPLHPSIEGAYLSALVIYAQLLKKTPKRLPATLRLNGGRMLVIDPLTAALLQQAAAEATGRQ